MDISFATRRLKKTCDSKKELQRAHGKACAKKTMRRLADLEAAATLEAVRNLPGRCHELDGDRKGQLALDLASGKRLILEPADHPPPVNEHGGLDWERVGAIRIVEIIDYHGS
jgi:proteic killer suppression protein